MAGAAAPQNRTEALVIRGLGRLVLCGLLAMAGTWLNYATVTVTDVNDKPAMMRFVPGG